MTDAEGASGLREAVEALADYVDEYAGTFDGLRGEGARSTAMFVRVALRALAAHPPEPEATCTYDGEAGCPYGWAKAEDCGCKPTEAAGGRATSFGEEVLRDRARQAESRALRAEAEWDALREHPPKPEASGRCKATDTKYGRCALDTHRGDLHAWEKVPGPPGPPQQWQTTQPAPSDLAAILAEHEWCWTRRDRASGEGIAIGCDCRKWTADLNGEAGWAAHRAHVAQVIADTYLPAVVREAEARAWDEGYAGGHSNAMRLMSDEPYVQATSNPYRAEDR